jgi:tetratricopeptide (TPR) repeat protein
MAECNMPSIPRPAPFAPDPKSACLCGSGSSYRRCCKGRLPGSKYIGKRWKTAAEAKRWVEVVRQLRADVTQYTIWHLSHTAPAVARKPELRSAWLMGIDIEALSDYVESLMWGYARKGWLSRLPATLDRLRGNIDDPRWLAKIAYQRGICALWQDDRDQAAKEIAGLQPITSDHTDVDLMQIHLDLHGQAMGLVERWAFFDRIRALSESRTDKLQYGGARAFEILLAGDEAGASAAFDEVIAAGRKMEEEDPLGIMATLWFCKSLEGRAVVGRDPALFTELDQRLCRLISEPSRLSGSGRASALRQLGDARRYGGLYDAAINAYQAADKEDEAPEYRVFQAECELRRGNPDEAFRLIRSVAVNALDAPERADHAFTSFYIALARGDRQSLLDARDLLCAAVTPQPYFEQRRLQHIVTIGDAIEALNSEQELPELGPILSALEKVSRYVQLQPNWNGLGINGNAMIDDFLANAQRRLQQQNEEMPTYPENQPSSRKGGTVSS